MKALFNLAAIAGLAILAAASAHAAGSTGASILGSGDIKVGIFGPSSSTARDNSGNTQIAAGADYSFPALPGAPHPNIYLDYQGGSKNNGHVNTLGLGVAAKWSPPLVGSITHINPYGGLGLGIYHTDVKNTQQAIAVSGSNTTIGGKIFAGLNFSKWLIEASYQWVPSVKGVDPKGYSLEVGLNF